MRLFLKPSNSSTLFWRLEFLCDRLSALNVTSLSRSSNSSLISVSFSLTLRSMSMSILFCLRSYCLLASSASAILSPSSDSFDSISVCLVVISAKRVLVPSVISFSEAENWSSKLRMVPVYSPLSSWSSRSRTSFSLSLMDLTLSSNFSFSSLRFLSSSSISCLLFSMAAFCFSSRS